MGLEQGRPPPERYQRSAAPRGWLGPAAPHEGACRQFGAPREARNPRIDLAPRYDRPHPALVRGSHDGRIVEGARLDVDVLRMLRRGRKDRGAAVRAKVTSEFRTAVAAFRELSGAPGDDAKPGQFEAHADVESATRAPPTVLTMAVVRGADVTGVFVADVMTETSPVNARSHRSSPGWRAARAS